MTDLWAPPTTPEQVIDHANALFSTQALLAGNRMGIFASLGRDGRKDAQALAKELGADARALATLLDALAGLGYLAKDAKGRYANSSVSKKHLVPGSGQAFLGDYLRFQDLLWESWGKLEQAVRTGQATRPANAFQSSPEETRRFVRAMSSTGGLSAPFLAQRLDLAGRKHLVDVGGGPGTYSIHFCRQFPELRATILDLPSALETAKEILAEEPPQVRERITLRACDFHKDDLGGPYDVAFVSHVIHGHSDHRVHALFMKLRDALGSNGLLLIHDFFTEASKTSPAFAALFSLNVLVMTDGGRTWSFDETREILDGLGYREVEWRRLGQPRGLSVVSAISPAHESLRPRKGSVE